MWADNKHEQQKAPLNVFNEVNENDKEEELPQFGSKADEPKDQSGFELKNYIKEMNKFLDEPAGK